MNKRSIIKKTAEYAKAKMSGESSGHDWWHTYRVWQNAIHISKKEKADLFVVELAALLHDIADWKFHDGDTSVGENLTREWLKSLSLEEGVISSVCQIIKNISFKGAGVDTKLKTPEGMVVQDADRLDAIGAIGIARNFAYGGSDGREIYNPEIPPKLHESFEQYKANRSSSINHFYEKSLLLKDLMNTATAKRMAKKRHSFMERYLKEFFLEWEGKI